MCKSASKKTNVLKSLKFTLDRKSLETIYFSFIRPTLEYANILWAGAADVDLALLDKIELESMRSITGSTSRSNIERLREEANFISLSERRDSHCLTFMFKLLHGYGQEYLKSFLPQEVGRKSNYSLRSNQNLSQPFCRLDILKRSFIHRTVKLWNNLDLTLRENNSLSTFRQNVMKVNDKKDYLYYALNRSAAIHHARLRVGCSKLNYHLCRNLHVITDESCMCGHSREDPFHFFMECPRFAAYRDALFVRVVCYANFDIRTVLFGDPNISFTDNCKVFDAVQCFIIESKRFE